MLDSIALERQGVPTVLVVTEVFEHAARAQAVQAGMPDLPILVVPHRIGWQTDSALAEMTEALLPSVVERLTRGQQG